MENLNENIELNEQVEAMEETKVEVEVMKESKIKTFLSKAGTVVKTHGKKIAIAGAVIVGAGIAYALGKGSNEDSEDNSLTFIDLDEDDDFVDQDIESEE